MNKKEVLELFKFLSAVYPQFNVDQYKLDEWTNLLADQAINKVMHNAREYAKTNKFPPSVAEIRSVSQAIYDEYIHDPNAGEDW